ncbi:MAG TPA: hypothetical protein VGR65_06005 [Casimicrobiaceae bacterium]|nr:hypothetical protein [Casimicrobiaceae bacterium]
MIGLDTNVLVRYLAQDDHWQAANALHLIEKESCETRPGLIAAVVRAQLVCRLDEQMKRGRQNT